MFSHHIIFNSDTIEIFVISGKSQLPKSAECFWQFRLSGILYFFASHVMANIRSNLPLNIRKIVLRLTFHPLLPTPPSRDMPKKCVTKKVKLWNHSLLVTNFAPRLQRIGKVYPNHMVIAISEPCSRADELFLIFNLWGWCWARIA